ncbi:glutamate-1-semialdehyde 2,1-aminomutase [Verrucomicrobium sp. GAS474]|uniref:glutamate-1-semialdehyde 2,1-aminomutase n=1 Tax=Verrucomicrobium sp. GAS474 TaxID=1882831 RepID=UPI00087CFB2F|nr:glutamate-1-semialdehyde 2,1-aminomutase [Verrucomicrobium sp. GAS474]SDU08591.1 glutamate-1-semialdehyde 2,1-aminomutase [Verrucomicrobium sp. GAS474]
MIVPVRSLVRSKALFAEALTLIPGGVNSPVRAFRNVGGEPFFAERAAGARVWDVDGNSYVDYVGTWGPAILGHAPEAVLRAVGVAAASGTSFGIPTAREVEMARKIVSWVPSVEKVRMTSSGTEACMAAVRLARGFTGRDKLIKFEGCYHGHGDSLLVKAGSGALTHGEPDSAGVPAAIAGLTLSLPFNDLAAVRAAFEQNRGQIAAVIVEPVPGNVGLLLPEPGFHEGLRTLCDAHGALLIFDEVMTGFRLAKGGAQEGIGVRPDLSTFGKVIGGGFPVGAFGGRAEVMDCLAPVGKVYQAGTLSGNPVAMAAGLAQLAELERLDGFRRLEEVGAALEAGLRGIFAKSARSGSVQLHRRGSMFSLFFTAKPVRNCADAMASDREVFRKLFFGLLERGVYIAPSPFEAGFLSLAHGADEVEETLRAVAEVVPTL